MAFIRRRGNSHQLIQTYRSKGKVRQRSLANLGPCSTIEEARQWWISRVREYGNELVELEAMARRLDPFRRLAPNPRFVGTCDKLDKRVATKRRQLAKAMHDRNAAAAMINT